MSASSDLDTDGSGQSPDLPGAASQEGDGAPAPRATGAPGNGDQSAPAPSPRRKPRAGTRRRATTNRKTKAKPTSKAATSKPASRRSKHRSFPAAPFEEAMLLAETIQRIGAGQRVRRIRVFEELDRSPESGTSRQLVTNSSRYGLTTGSFQADWLELTENGLKATSSEIGPREQTRARFDLAIAGIAPFGALYERFHDHRLPTHAVMRDFLVEEGFGEDEVQECVETFIVNAKFLGLLRTIAGAERLLSIDQVLDELPRTPSNGRGPLLAGSTRPDATRGEPASHETGDWARVCYCISPIGADESEERQHADTILGALVEPAMEELGLMVIRADQIDKPGLITSQVIEHIAKAGLVIADLSFHNPNVFYELALRHASGKPTVQLIRAADRIPFDVEQVRTVKLDMSNLYNFVPQIETYKAEIATHARRALEGGESGSPLAILYPSFASEAVTA
jgi:hypothetical protein